MPLLESLELTDFRNYSDRRFEFTSDDVVLTGKNGSGKTTVLEAIHYLSILRSFRTRQSGELIRIGSEGFRLCGLLRKNGYCETLSVVQQGGKNKLFQIDDRRIFRGSEFIREFTSVVFVPEDHLIIGGAAAYRRMFFDMLISKIEPLYMEKLAVYQRALNQRNKALKSNASKKLIAAFDAVLSETVPLLCERRAFFADELKKILSQLVKKYWNAGLEIVYRKNYPEKAEAYAALLAENYTRDSLRRATSTGPQLDDFIFLLDGHELRTYGSTGQIRLVSLLLKLAEFDLLRKSLQKRLVLLVDDVTGELDRKNKKSFFDATANAEQRFFTFAEEEAAKQINGGQVFQLNPE